MADGWRNRFRAPVYALGISFTLVVILGAALNVPTQKVPTLNDPTKIQFIEQGKSAKEVPHLDVRVETVAAKRQLARVPLGQQREFTLLIPGEEIRICAKPPGWIAENANGWTAENAEGDGGSESCWVGRPARGKDVVLMLVPRKG